ncbi:hypothetical protein CLOSTASPAR_03282 [[Clostridium] asparagiforme DSM 15981]|uniref:Uncharacterized protein n=1 Tax=[Clostridium] asparagiforme DSM 15981 TaxID=518636 RepID=C0D1Z3_9FIRM|nr:hypothetical protein CLOSTASPAR_03282 [[Clostridium] asparagiforme DSM 15981]
MYSRRSALCAPNRRRPLRRLSHSNSGNVPAAHCIQTEGCFPYRKAAFFTA